MKIRFTQFFIFLVASVIGLSSCYGNSEAKEDVISHVGSSTMVNSFSIRPNYKVMAYLDSVFFSIDQTKGEIFNADSLPWGTDVRKLVVKIGVRDSTGGVEIIMPKLSDGTDTVINMIENSSDSINFSHGKVWLRVTSSNGEYERIYNVKVNVHQCNSDSLQWIAKSTPTKLPAQPTGLYAQRAVEMNNTYYSLSRGSSDVIMSTTADPTQGPWENNTLTGLPDDINVNSLVASADALYMLTESGSLLTSTDGLAWHEVQTGWSYIYGGYGNDIVGVKDNSWVTYPSNTSGDLHPDMPVKGTSQMWTYTNEWAISPQAILAGGIKANGEYTGATWAFDGQSWAQLSNRINERELPAAQGYQIFPYFTFRVNKTNFFANKQSAWFALGGITADGKTQPNVYVSLDNGVNWVRGKSDVQLPQFITPRAGASMLLKDVTFTATRASKPITEWNAPAILMLGGYSPQGTIYNEIHVGFINRATFKPLQ